MRRPGSWSATLIGLALGAACAPSPTPRLPESAAPQTAVAPPVLQSSQSSPAPAASTTSSSDEPSARRPAAAPPSTAWACRAPSLALRAPRDRVDAVPDCASLGPIVGGTDPRACGSVPPVGGVARLDEAVPVLDVATRERIEEIAHRGVAEGRNIRAFGLVGDSITEGLLFLGPFAAGSTQPVELDRDVEAGFATTIADREASILDVYRGIPVEKLAGFTRDSFRAMRAAKVGAPSAWALAPGDGGKSPLATMIDRVNPAVAIVMYGSNDAAAGLVPIDVLTARFEANLRGIVRELDAAGIIPVLSTIPRRGPQADLRDCAPEGLSDARVMVQTNAVSAVAARIACEERLPLIDLRHAFDGLVSAGLFSDGIHPTSHPRGSGVLTVEGLGCGYNARNYLALRALRNVRQSLLEDAWR